MKWTSVKKALPSDTRLVLVYGDFYMDIGGYCDECKEWFILEGEDERPITNVTHWMDLPDLPSEDD